MRLLFKLAVGAALVVASGGIDRDGAKASGDSLTSGQAPAATQPVDPLLPPPMPVLPHVEIPGTQPAATTLPAPATAPAPQPTIESSTAAIPTTRPAAPAPAAAGPAGIASQMVVTSTLDASLVNIAPSLGASAYTIGPQQIDTVPQGEDAPFQQILLRMPSVVEDSFGQEHVRGEHADLTYRLNGVILPEPLNGFGQELDSHLIQSVTLIDGSLPAEFGFRTAGVVDVTTKSGASLSGSSYSIYGGSYNTFQPSFQTGGTSGNLDYFITGSYKTDSLGIENPTSARTAIHDDTEQSRLFSYLSYHLDDTSRVSLLLNGSYANFQIPDTAGLRPAFALAGAGAASSAQINENQNEQQYYAVLAYQKTLTSGSFQASAFSSYGLLHFKPDLSNDLIFQGVSGNVLNDFVTNGLQVDSAWNVDPHHTLRAGFIADYTIERNDTNTAVFATDPTTGQPTSDVPFNIVDDTRNHATDAGAYVQDEWELSPKLTLNYGVRYDRFDANFDHEGQLSPRVNLVWKIDKATTAHVGYSRYFDPPAVQYVSPATIDKFANTTNAPANFIDDPPRAERSNYFDAGISRQVDKHLSVSVDGYYKQSHNLIDLGQFGEAVILSPFNYRDGHVYGAEISTNYQQGPFSAFGNFGWVQTGGRDIDSQQFLIDNDELAYIKDHFIKLDHESQLSASMGVSYKFSGDDLVYADMIYGSGLRSGFANTQEQPAYYPVNIGYQHVFHTGDHHALTLRFDVVNAFDGVFQLRDGSGIGVAAPQYSQRRGFYVGLSGNF